MKNAPAAKLFPYHPGKGTTLGLGNIADLEPGGIQLISGSQRGDDGNGAGQGSFDQIQFTGDQIDRVYDKIIISGKKGFPVLWGVTIDKGMNFTAWSDLGYPLCHGLRLGASYCVNGSLQLAV